MESPEEIEKALSRLVPAAFSEQGKRSLDELIDGLAAGETTVIEMAPDKSKPLLPWAGGIAAAAAAVVLAMNFPAGGPSAPSPGISQAPPEIAGETVLLHQSERVEAAVPEDWMTEADGVAYRAWRVRVVGEERLHDVQTGYEVLVSRPREEVRLIPVSSF
jgi:hypothetical protein